MSTEVTPDPLRAHAEWVESLRAERDKALTNARTWEDLADGWRDRAIELRGDVREAEAIIARLRATHTEAEAAWERCKRQPRVWGEGDSAPESYIRVRDKHGQAWVWQNYRPDHGSVWRTSDGHLIGAWDWLCEHQGPLIEVLS